MKNIILCVLCSVLSISVYGQDNKGVIFTDKSYNELLQQAKESDKLLFVDCFTDWCGPCRKMAKEVFTTQTVGDYLNSKFVSAKINMEKGEGIQLNDAWDIGAYPTFLVINNDGCIKFRLTGYYEPKAFVDTISYMINDLTISKEAKAYQDGNHSAIVVEKYINELLKKYERKKAKAIAEEYCNKNKELLLNDSVSLKIFLQNIKDPHNQSFLYVYSNRDMFIQKYGKKIEEALEYNWKSYAKNFYIMEGIDLKGYDIVKMNDYEKYMIENGVSNASSYTMSYKLPASFIIKDKSLLIKNLREACVMPEISQGQFDYGCDILKKMIVSDEDKKILDEIYKSRVKLNK